MSPSTLPSSSTSSSSHLSSTVLASCRAADLAFLRMSMFETGVIGNKGNMGRRRRSRRGGGGRKRTAGEEDEGLDEYESDEDGNYGDEGSEGGEWEDNEMEIE